MGTSTPRSSNANIGHGLRGRLSGRLSALLKKLKTAKGLTRRALLAQYRKLWAAMQKHKKKHPQVPGAHHRHGGAPRGARRGGGGARRAHGAPGQQQQAAAPPPQKQGPPQAQPASMPPQEAAQPHWENFKDPAQAKALQHVLGMLGQALHAKNPQELMAMAQQMAAHPEILQQLSASPQRAMLEKALKGTPYQGADGQTNWGGLQSDLQKLFTPNAPGGVNAGAPYSPFSASAAPGVSGIPATPAVMTGMNGGGDGFAGGNFASAAAIQRLGPSG